MNRSGIISVRSRPIPGSLGPLMALPRTRPPQQHDGQTASVTAKKAQQLKIDEDLVLDQLQSAFLATGAAKTMVTEYRSRLASNPLDVKALVLLIEMMAASVPPELIDKGADRVGEQAADGGADARLSRPCRWRSRRTISERSRSAKSFAASSGRSRSRGFVSHAVLAQKQRAKEAALDTTFGTALG